LRLAILTLDILSMVLAFGLLLANGKKWARWPAIVGILLLGTARYLHFQHDVSWVLLGKVGIYAAIPLAMALMGNHLAAEIVASKTEKILWRSVFFVVAFLGITGSFFLEREIDRAHNIEVTTLYTKLDWMKNFLGNNPPSNLTKQQMSEVLQAFAKPVPNATPLQESPVLFGMTDDMLARQTLEFAETLQARWLKHDHDQADVVLMIPVGPGATQDQIRAIHRQQAQKQADIELAYADDLRKLIPQANLYRRAIRQRLSVTHPETEEDKKWDGLFASGKFSLWAAGSYLHSLARTLSPSMQP
jgi:hypothetical protein